MYSSPDYSSGYMKILQSPSLDFALWASVALRHCSKFAPGNFVTKGVNISSLMCMDAQISRAQDAQERCFHYAIQINRTTLHAVQLRIPG